MRILIFLSFLFLGSEALAQTTVSPSRVNFFDVEVGRTALSKAVFVNNLSSEDVNVNVSHGCFGAFFVSNSCFQLRRNGSCTIRINYSPRRVGSDSCSIRVTTTGRRTDFKTVWVSGRGVDRRR